MALKNVKTSSEKGRKLGFEVPELAKKVPNMGLQPTKTRSQIN
jgi:hypothetical protein